MYNEPSNYETDCCIESNTPCVIHRYHVVHLCGCGKLYSHSQGDCNEHKLHPIGINIPSRFYNHGETAKQLLDKLQVYGLLPYGENGLNNVYFYFSDNEKDI
jgi:hypothetical protein